MRVRLADLNLATDAGAHIALARIRWNAGLFCEAGVGRQSLQRVDAVDHCVGDMTRKSVSQLNAPLVKAKLDRGGDPILPSATLALARK